MDLIASWFGAANAAVILTREQYMKGFYTKREAGYIMTNFSLVSVPFCLMVANTIGLDSIFPVFYLCIWPHRHHPGDDHRAHSAYPHHTGHLSGGDGTAGGRGSARRRREYGDLPWSQAARERGEFHLDTVLTSGWEVMMGTLFDLIPIVASWGVIALAIATYTPFFDWIS